MPFQELCQAQGAGRCLLLIIETECGGPWTILVGEATSAGAPHGLPSLGGCPYFEMKRTLCFSPSAAPPPLARGGPRAPLRRGPLAGLLRGPPCSDCSPGGLALHGGHQHQHQQQHPNAEHNSTGNQSYEYHYSSEKLRLLI